MEGINDGTEAAEPSSTTNRQGGLQKDVRIKEVTKLLEETLTDFQRVQMQLDECEGKLSQTNSKLDEMTKLWCGTKDEVCSATQRLRDSQTRVKAVEEELKKARVAGVKMERDMYDLNVHVRNIEKKLERKEKEAEKYKKLKDESETLLRELKLRYRDIVESDRKKTNDVKCTAEGLHHIEKGRVQCQELHQFTLDDFKDKLHQTRKKYFHNTKQHDEKRAKQKSQIVLPSIKKN